MDHNLKQQVLEILAREDEIIVLQQQRAVSDVETAWRITKQLWQLIDNFTVLLRPQLIKDLYEELENRECDNGLLIEQNNYLLEQNKQLMAECIKANSL